MIDYEAEDWLRILARTRGSVLPRLAGRVLLSGLIAVGAALLHAQMDFALPPVAHGLIGVALGLLLVFRTNASYDRFWEGRKLLGQLVIATRDLMRQVVTHVGDRDGERAELRRLMLAFYALSVQRLREDDALAEVTHLTDAERAELEGVTHRPQVVATWISSRLQHLLRSSDGGVTELRLNRVDGNVSDMLAALAGCERIRFTPVPFAYAQHIKVFLALFCFTSPFAMVDGMGWWTPLAAMSLTLALFGIDEIGVEIEDPFGDDPNDLPMDAIGLGLAGVTEEMLRSPQPHAAPVSIAPPKG